MKHIATIYTDLPEKFGVPRQSGLVEELTGKIIFNPPYNAKEAFDGIEEYSHLWVLWEFSENIRSEFSPTVRPPRLGGEQKKGVFATRSPFRPNPIGLSCVKLLGVEQSQKYGTVLKVGGVDMKNGTPIYDIKPYIYSDIRPNAAQGFAQKYKDYALDVLFPQELLAKIPPEKQAGILGILRQDPRPAYQNDSERVYGVAYCDFNVKFTVDNKTLTVTAVEARL